MTVDIFRDIEGYKGIYQISNTGIIKSLDRKIQTKNGVIRFLKGKVLKQSLNTYGYKTILLCANGISKNKLVHRLIANTFIENKDNNICINHKDGVKTNNNICNLEWVTHSENLKHAYDLKLKIPNVISKVKGVDHKLSKLNESDVIKIYNLNKPQREIASIFNISLSRVNQIKNKKAWVHLQL
jgi:DNA-directed RNA polymerase specialized sigma subunit